MTHQSTVYFRHFSVAWLLLINYVLGSISVCWCFWYWIISKLILIPVTKEDEEQSILSNSNLIILMYLWYLWQLHLITPVFPSYLVFSGRVMCFLPSVQIVLCIFQNIVLSFFFTSLKDFQDSEHLEGGFFLLLFLSLVPSAVLGVTTIKNLSILFNKRGERKYFHSFSALWRFLRYDKVVSSGKYS